MVRWESVIIALFGTIGGLGVGPVPRLGADRGGAWTSSAGAFTAPVGRPGRGAGGGGLAGVLAAVRPARRAGRLDVLAAIATD